MGEIYKKMWEMCTPKMGICGSMFMPHTIMHKGLKIATLMALREQPLTGYAVTKYIEDKYGYFLRADVVYPTLQMLDDMEYVKQTEEENKKKYSLTDEGRRFLEENSNIVEWLDWWAQRPKMRSEHHCG
jgi:DNA-binding PadR family transcriptional regulator